MATETNPPSRSARPRVICHMLTGLDARVDVSSWCATAGVKRSDQADLYYELMRGFGARGYIVGRVTMDPYATGMAEDPGGAPPARRLHLGVNRDLPLAVVQDPSGKLHWESGVLDGEHLVMVLGPDVPDSHLRELASRGISYLVSPTQRIDPDWLLAELAEHFGATLMLVEGGAVINGLFLEAGLVDEFSLLMIPALDGSEGARNLVETSRSMTELKQSLKSVEALEHQAVHLRYAVNRDTSVRVG